MKKLTTIFTYIIRVLAFILVGINLVRVFKDFEFLFFLQRPPLLAFANSLAFLGFSFLRPILKGINIEVSDLFYFITSVSMVLTHMIGLIFHFYQSVPYYDSFAHFLNGGLLVLVGLMFLSVLVEKEKLAELSPFFIVLFAFLFASTLGLVWEMVEYTVDGIFGSNMQRFAQMHVIDGVPVMGDNLIGREVLLDTMRDIFLNTAGGLIISIFIYFDLKKEFPLVNSMYIRRINKDKEDN